ncbi:MAG: hypothetical protein ABSC05_10575 [Candidatus Solibacter sp.]|jgi:hypothetical protein
MKIPLKIARSAVFGLALASSAMLLHAQESKPPEKKAQENKKKNETGSPQHSAPSGQHTAPSGQHTAPPVQQSAPAVQHTAPPVQQSTPPAQQNTSRPQRPDSQTQPRPGVTTTTPPTHQTQPNNPSVYRAPQSTPGAQPGRTFGTNPPAGGAVGARPGGPPARTFTTPSGDVVHRDAGGQVRQVHLSNGTTVYHPPNAPRRVEVVRPGGTMVVASSPGHGYVQRSVVINNTTIIKRTYIYNGVPQAMIYRPRVFNGITLAVYTPVRYYRPTFYAYAYNPWARPVAYTWGWGGSPWYGYYGGYFTPYPIYASPSLWLTDFFIAATLESAYQERMAARATGGGIYQDGGQSPPMTPEVKQAIADEVRRQIDLERAQGQNAGAGGGQGVNIFADNVPHVFVAHSTLFVNSNVGECAISEGDVLRMNGPPPMNSPVADVVVLASRRMDCRRGSLVSVQLQDLQEMHNQMVAAIDRGMGDLQAKQGQGGLPPLPQGSAGTIDTPFVQGSQPDANVASELTSVSQEADRAEQQAVGQAGDTPSGPTPTLTLGLSVDQVKAIQGEPQKIVDLGSKQIYMYKDLKITFSDGKVVDIQ